MGKIRDYFYNKKLDRFERSLIAVQNRIKFNPQRAQFNFSQYLNTDTFTNTIMEYKVWQTGNSAIIRNFYLTGYQNNFENKMYFWQTAPSKYIKRHCSIPRQIANKNGSIIFGGDFKISVDVYKKSETSDEITDTINEKESKKTTDTINALVDKMNLLNSLRKQAVIDSWCGHSFAKLNFDTTLSDYPIYEVFDLTRAEAIVERGITTAYVFKSWYQKKLGGTKVDYVFKETYTTDDRNNAMIVNELFKLENDKEVRCPLTEIEETRGLNDSFVFEGLKGLIAFGKPNTLPNNEFPETPYGASDYQGAIDSFDALDEAYSELIAEIRNNKTIRYIPSSMLPNDGSFDPFVNNYQKLEGGSQYEQDSKNGVDIQQIDDKTESILAKYKQALITAINCAGLSPLALGITGLEAINAGEASQKERNRVTLETRKDKIQNYWTPYLKDLITQLLAFNNWLVKNQAVNQEGIDTSNITFENSNVILDFGNYIVEDETNVINRWIQAKSGGLSSIENGVREIHPDWSEEQINEEVTKIKFENNIGVDDPTLLQMDLITETTTEEENGEDTE